MMEVQSEMGLGGWVVGIAGGEGYFPYSRSGKSSIPKIKTEIKNTFYATKTPSKLTKKYYP
jgi:hypothetical protein